MSTPVVMAPVDLNGILICLGSKVAVVEKAADGPSTYTIVCLVREKQGQPWLWNGYDFWRPLSDFYVYDTTAGRLHRVSIC